MNYCPNCGSKLGPGHNFCPNCGQNPSQESSEKTQRPNTKKRNNWVLPIIIVILIIAIGGIAAGVVIGLNSGGNSSSNSNGGNHYYQPTYTYPTYTYQPQPTYTPYTPTQQHVLLSNYTMFGPSNEVFDYTIEAGKTISVSWSADGLIYVWILTETQYDYFINSMWGVTTTNYQAFKTGETGNLVYNVTYTDTYYIVIRNTSYVSGVKVYSATASW